MPPFSVVPHIVLIPLSLTAHVCELIWLLQFLNASCLAYFLPSIFSPAESDAQGWIYWWWREPNGLVLKLLFLEAKWTHLACLFRPFFEDELNNDGINEWMQFTYDMFGYRALKRMSDWRMSEWECGRGQGDGLQKRCVERGGRCMDKQSRISTIMADLKWGISLVLSFFYCHRVFWRQPTGRKRWFPLYFKAEAWERLNRSSYQIGLFLSLASFFFFFLSFCQCETWHWRDIDAVRMQRKTFIVSSWCRRQSLLRHWNKNKLCHMKKISCACCKSALCTIFYLFTMY